MWGGNVIDKIIAKEKIANDNNYYLIEFWKALQKGWNPLEEVNMNKTFYDDVKNNKDKYPSEIVALCGLCATYNAKWFGGYCGIVTTKIGTIRDYYNEAVRNVLKQVPKVKDVQFICGEYNIYNFKNSVIYCDPPYKGTTKYVTEFDHDKYWEYIRKISKDNYVLCSEYEAPDDFKCIWQGEITTTLDKSSRKKNIEKLFCFKQGLINI